MAKTTRIDVAEIVTSRIISALERGVAPWRKPWSEIPAELRTPKNAVSNKPYRGLNVWILSSLGYDDNRFLTFKQAQGLKGKVRKGAKSTPVVFWKFIDDETTDENGEISAKRHAILRYYNVFHISDVEGVDWSTHKSAPKVGTVKTFDTNVEDNAEELISRMPNKPTFLDGDSAFYRPSDDTLTMPTISRFEHVAEYYSTRFHELVHSTGHKSRLNRHEFEGGLAPFGTPRYSREELVAELGAAILCSIAGVDNELSQDNSAAYIGSWLKVLDDDRRLLLSAAAHAQRAADYVSGGAGGAELDEAA